MKRRNRKTRRNRRKRTNRRRGGAALRVGMPAAPNPFSTNQNFPTPSPNSPRHALMQTNLASTSMTKEQFNDIQQLHGTFKEAIQILEAVQSGTPPNGVDIYDILTTMILIFIGMAPDPSVGGAIVIIKGHVTSIGTRDLTFVNTTAQIIINGLTQIVTPDIITYEFPAASDKMDEIREKTRDQLDELQKKLAQFVYHYGIYYTHPDRTLPIIPDRIYDSALRTPRPFGAA